MTDPSAEVAPTTDPLADGTHELAIRFGRPFDAWVAGGYLSGVTEIVVPFDGQDAAETAAAEIVVAVRPGTRPAPGGTLAAFFARLRDAERRLAEQDAEIARLRAELDAASDKPVEYVTTSGLAAAMEAEPSREDGSVLRVTDGGRQAYAWRAASGMWEAVQ